MSTRTTGFVLLAFAMATVGSTVPASRLAGEGLPPFTATALRFALALPFFILLLRWQGLAWPKLDRRSLLLLAVQAGAGSVGYTVLLIAGTSLTSAADAGVLLGTLPAMATLFAAVVLRERLGGRGWVAAAMATAGAVAVSLGGLGGGAFSAAALLGNALVLMAVGCEALFILLNRRLAVPLAPLAQAAVMTGLGLGFSLVGALLVDGPTAGSGAPAGALLAVAYYALVPTVLGFLAWFAGAARTTAAQAALFTAVAPATAVILAALVLGDALTPARLAGLALVLAGIVLGAWPRQRKAHG